jgi:regulatory protein
MTRRTTPAPPLNTATLERLALRYVERFATTRAKLASYLHRKLRERDWEDADPPPVDQLVDRIARLGYVDDRAWAEAKSAAMTRRGLGARRVQQALHHAGVTGDDAAAAMPEGDEHAIESALAFARRKRIGPFAREAADRAQIERQVAQMARAGHAPGLARRIASIPPGDLSHGNQPLDFDKELIRSLS